MLSFFRRIIYSRVGVVVTLGVLVLIALAFAAGDITGLRAPGQAGLKGDEIARVGKARLTDIELRDRVRLALDGARQSNPAMDITQFLSLGGFESILNQMIDSLAIEQFGMKSGLMVSKRMVDGEIASIPAFQGLSGKFDQKTYEALLQQRHVTDAQLRDDLRREIYRQWLLAPTQGAALAPRELALPYASLLLERRHGTIAFLPGQSFGPGPAPTEAELTAFYNSHRAAFTIPERRVIRYAVVLPDRVKAQSVPSEAEIQAAYKAAGSRFAATEKRTIRQVVSFDQNAANALAAKVKAGTSIADAAKQAGLEPTTLTSVEKADYARQSSDAVANAAFGAEKGAVVGPVRSQLGWHVLVVDSIEKIAGKTLEEARPTLVTELTQRKAADALSKIQEALDDGINDNSTFDELVSDQKLTAERTPAMLPNGGNPDDPNWKAPDINLQPILRAGFASAIDDDPQVVSLGQDGSFALIKLEKIVPPTPRPLSAVRDVVTKQFLTDRALKAAREAAVKLVAAANGGKPLAQAVQAAGVQGAKVDPVAFTRAQLAAAGDRVPPPVTLMFSMAAGKAKLVEAPDRSGYFVVHLDQIENGDASKRPEVIADAQRGLGGAMGRELTEQFVGAMNRDVKVTRNEAAIKRVRDELSGQGAAN